MEHQGLKQNIEILIENELESARAKFGNFNSSHEGYAVVLEEFEEFKEEEEEFEKNIQALWGAVKSNDINQQTESIRLMEEISKRMIKEGIQIAAMCRRFNGDVLGGK